jgi:CubicO group peptidase (beta-lactamase class C family)
MPGAGAAVTGTVDPTFRRVADLFDGSIAAGEERGAISVRINGRSVLDLWGGASDPKQGTEWREDTLACCFSVTKGVFALAAQVLIDRGALDPDLPVCRYWPAFAQGGKDAVTVRDVLTHRAGLPAVSGPVERGMLYDDRAMVTALEASEPVVPPRAAPVYHNMTYGYLVGELVRRVSGEPPAAFIAREIAGPLGADFGIGLSSDETARVAVLTQDDPEALFRSLAQAPHSLFSRSMRFFAEGEDFNTPRWRGAVIGSGNGHATAHGITRLYETFIRDGLLSPSRRSAIGSLVAESAGPDPILGIAIRYGEGVELSTPPGLDFGPSPRAIGYWGAGGAQGFADPEASLAFGYVTGRMDPAMGTSLRVRSLVAELYAAL